MASDLVEDQAHEAYMIRWSEELKALDAAYREDEAMAGALLDEQKRKFGAEIGEFRSGGGPIYERLIQLENEIKTYKLRDTDLAFNEAKIARKAAHRKARVEHYDKLKDYIRSIMPLESQARSCISLERTGLTFL